MSHSDPHLDSERIQGFLDRRLGPEAEEAVRSHLSDCARCRGEVQAWRTLFTRLSDLPEVAPSAAFREKVLGAVETPAREGILEKIRRRLAEILPSWIPGATGEMPDRHLEPRVVLGYLDGALPRRRERAVALHAEGCPTCREELGRWSTLVQHLESLGRVGPSPGFGDAVMARVQIRQHVENTAPSKQSGGVVDRLSDVVDGLSGQLERLRPRTRLGWAVAGVAALAPVTALSGAALALFTSHPLLTPASLAAFLWWQVTGAVQALATMAADRILASPAALELWRAAEGISGEPLMAGVGAAAFGLTTVTALWILYRNLTANPPADRGYANVSA
ncbi:MAG: zf-HC2 domain-containing protein [Longimicrobiales bacterium]|nr:zf-HC2 domain-containing protein [Longimicrobiales bacterium]